MTLPTPTYDPALSYEENYERGPQFDGPFPDLSAPAKPFDFLGFTLNSPLGVPAGPLLNSAYVSLYAKLGWDVPVYKTVRSVARACHPAPNCLYIPSDPLTEADAKTQRTTAPEPKNVEDLSITNSFGMPSKDPSEWMKDVQVSEAAMKPGQLQIISITGTPDAGGRSLGDDFAYTAALAREAGAKVIEANFSCPNVVSREGSLFADPENSSAITAKIRKEIGDIPLLIKIGAVPEDKLADVIRANAPYIDGIAAINTVPLHIVNEKGEQALPGKGRLQSGVCGAAIRNVGADMTSRLVKLRGDIKSDLAVVSVGGVMDVADIDARLAAGADLVMSATAAMWDPLLASKWRAAR